MPSRWEMPPVYLQSGDPEAESTPTLHAPGLLGARFTIINTQRQAPGVETSPAGRSKRYQLVKTDSTMATAPYNGAVAHWADKAGYVVTTAVSTGRNAIAGIFRRTWAAAGDYMCVQIGGPGYVKHVDAPTGGAMAAGDAVIPSATAGKADRTAAGTAPTYRVLGTVSEPLTVQAGNAMVLTDLDVPETT